MSTYAERIMRGLGWCQSAKVGIDCTDGSWQIDVWNEAGERLTTKSHHEFLDAVADAQRLLRGGAEVVPIRAHEPMSETDEDREGIDQITKSALGKLPFVAPELFEEKMRFFIETAWHRGKATIHKR